MYLCRFYEFERKIPWFGSILADPQESSTFDDMFSHPVELKEDLEEVNRYSLNTMVMM